ncbi:hypothetical protein [Halocatena pleomorpha]|uniref:MBL fold metallo-hydrolase n=1 Tax=Halocatena pleomorpha TaxID=1785090 RepID=A0A3P3RA37_9EURY|nr:hypothetical protein [Halocatena pleomorpha]RRJ30274.1 hypothetical protein EIK79_10140 [Halocatena pleomorpha]
MYHRYDSGFYREIDRWKRGVGWVAHPEEGGARASHAVVGNDGDVWVVDPLDAPGVDALLSEFGTVAGVAVLSNYHARDAGVVATRHDVPVYLPQWMDRVAERVDAPTERYAQTLGGSGFVVHRCSPLPGWQEGIAYRQSDRTLYVPDVLGTGADWTVGSERIALFLLARLFPPSVLGQFAPDRILVGHGEGVFENASAALDAALTGARRRFPAALRSSGVDQLRALVRAL